MNKSFNKDQLIIIDQGRDLGLTKDQECVYANPEFSWEQMWEIQQGFLNGLTKEQIVFADPSLDYKTMYEKRKELEHLLGLSEREDSLLEDSNVRNVIEILKENGMDQELNDYLSVLCRVDALNDMTHQQEMEILFLERELKKQPNKKIINQANDLIAAVKRDIQSLKEGIKNVKDNIKSGAKLLVDTFKLYGKTAFCKISEEFYHDIQGAFRFLQNNNLKNLEKTEEHINTLKYLYKEASAAKTHFKNTGRILFGKSAKPVGQDKNISLILKPSLNFFENHKKRLSNFNNILNECFSSAERLEKSFSNRARENKKDLNSLIFEGFSKQNQPPKNKNQFKNEHNR